MLDAWIDRYMRVVSPNLNPGRWAVQKVHGEPFSYRSFLGTRDDLHRMLLGQYWIACRAPEDQTINWLSFDIDKPAQAAIHDCTDTYWTLRELMGKRRVPLVYNSPGGGLRLLYRIPATRLETAIQRQRRGLIADAVRGTGLEVAPGIVEVFPQRKLADRLPLGRSMPLLDPESLQIMPRASIGDEHDPDILQGALEELEKWYARPYGDLLAHLMSADVPKRSLMRLVSHAPSADSSRTQATSALFAQTGNGRGITFSAEAEQLIARGLSAPSTRHESEWKVGLMMVVAPERFGEFGLHRLNSDDAVAFALARWLSVRHNGHSKEWSQDMHRLGNADDVVRRWARDRFQAADSRGETMIDRLHRCRANVDPMGQRVRQIHPAEWTTIFELAETHFPKGAQRMRFEVWSAAFFRAVKEVAHYHRWISQGNRFQVVETNGSTTHLVVELAAEWMEAWPYGQGRASRSGLSRYCTYRDVLVAGGLVAPAGNHSRFGPADIPGQARRFTVRPPEPTALRDIAVAPWVLATACEGFTVGNRTSTKLSLDEAYHALEVERRGYAMRNRYGYSAGSGLKERLEKLKIKIEHALEGSHQRREAA